MSSLLSFAAVLASLILTPLETAPVAINPNKPITVCQALQNRAQYRGKVIELEGEWGGAALFGNCPELRTGTHNWPNVVLVTFPSVRDVDTPVNWTLDMTAFRNSQTKAENLLRSGTEAIKATIIGRFESRAELMSQGRLHGYGQEGAAPAQLVLISVKTVGPMTKPR